MARMQKIVNKFRIPDDLAKNLSDLLIKQTIRERLMIQLIDQPDKFEAVEAQLIPITAKIEAIKQQITSKYVPKEYQFPQYTWNYNGWEVAANECEILESYDEEE